MYLEIVTDSKEIRSLHKTLGQNLAKFNDNKSPRQLEIATRGGAGIFNYSFNSETGLWWSNQPGGHNWKFYNRFGFDPKESTVNRMVVQVNYLKDITGLREGAIWAQGTKGNYYLLHSGRMGGGVEGITKENISKIIRWDDVATVDYAGKEVDFYVVCELSDKKMFYQISAFVKEIARVKAILFNKTTGGSKTPPKSGAGWSAALKKYKPEFWGKREYNFSKRIKADCNHGYVVQELMQRVSSLGEMVKNRYVDLGVMKKGKPMAIFEVKTSATKQHIYTAVGQLMMHAHTSKVKPQKYFVVTDDIDDKIIEDLSVLGILTITYSWNGLKPRFKNLDVVFDNA